VAHARHAPYTPWVVLCAGQPEAVYDLEHVGRETVPAVTAVRRTAGSAMASQVQGQKAEALAHQTGHRCPAMAVEPDPVQHEQGRARAPEIPACQPDAVAGGDRQLLHAGGQGQRATNPSTVPALSTALACQQLSRITCT
jgi:hypothetical protein